MYRQLLLPAASVVIALMSITALTPQAVVVIVLEVVDVEVELVVTLAITALTPQTALSAVTHHWSRVVGRNQPTCPTYTGGGHVNKRELEVFGPRMKKNDEATFYGPS